MDNFLDNFKKGTFLKIKKDSFVKLLPKVF